jgi:hypothetical protein
VAGLPTAGQALNGRPIQIGENPFGWETMILTFKEGEDTADIRFNNGMQLSVGLDNLYRVQDLPGSGKVGFRATWEHEDRFTVQQIILGTWNELEVSLTVEGDQVTFFQRNVVDGGDLVRIEGKLGVDLYCGLRGKHFSLFTGRSHRRTRRFHAASGWKSHLPLRRDHILSHPLFQHRSDPPPAPTGSDPVDLGDAVCVC